MKFGHEFREVLEKERFPPNWVDTAIPYRTLKKLLKKVQGELEGLGLDPATLAQLHQSSPEEEDGNGNGNSNSNGLAFQYDFEGDEKFVPKLRFYIDVENGTPISAALSPETRRYFEAQALKPKENPPASPLDNDGQTDNPPSEETTITEESDNLRRIDVQLRFDAEFFGLLQGDVTSLDNLQAQEQKNLTDEIQALSSLITEVSKPRPGGFHKTDLNRWRQLFDLYLQAGIFFSTNEFDHGSRTSAMAAQKLQWFQGEVVKQDIMGLFKLKASHEALQQFVKINIGILQHLKFHEINQRAFSKILKKFDKRTNLGAAKTFPKLIMSDTNMSDSMSKAVCAQVSQQLLQIVPQVEDYSCPICCDICWRPVRLNCKHLICIRCAVVLQKQMKRTCPMCREDVIMKADTDNIDRDLEKFLRKYFPKEVLQKQIANETAHGIEQFGPYYTHPSESNCVVM
ncbi:SPX domain-containing protein [Rhexocercosporidium sp. MPI-PUGE-AT-0058]|nr:SPX domain-containing protein [Rhexocercosporidium sp. MPI-PUGE-AT-0058]